MGGSVEGGNSLGSWAQERGLVTQQGHPRLLQPCTQYSAPSCWQVVRAAVPRHRLLLLCRRMRFSSLSSAHVEFTGDNSLAWTLPLICLLALAPVVPLRTLVQWIMCAPSPVSGSVSRETNQRQPHTNAAWCRASLSTEILSGTLPTSRMPSNPHRVPGTAVTV